MAALMVMSARLPYLELTNSFRFRSKVNPSGGERNLGGRPISD